MSRPATSGLARSGWWSPSGAGGADAPSGGCQAGGADGGDARAALLVAGRRPRPTGPPPAPSVEVLWWTVVGVEALAAQHADDAAHYRPNPPGQQQVLLRAASGRRHPVGDQRGDPAAGPGPLRRIRRRHRELVAERRDTSLGLEPAQQVGVEQGPGPRARRRTGGPGAGCAGPAGGAASTRSARSPVPVATITMSRSPPCNTKSPTGPSALTIRPGRNRWTQLEPWPPATARMQTSEVAAHRRRGRDAVPAADDCGRWCSAPGRSAQRRPGRALKPGSSTKTSELRDPQVEPAEGLDLALDYRQGRGAGGGLGWLPEHDVAWTPCRHGSRVRAHRARPRRGCGPRAGRPGRGRPCRPRPRSRRCRTRRPCTRTGLTRRRSCRHRRASRRRWRRRACHRPRRSRVACRRG